MPTALSRPEPHAAVAARAAADLLHASTPIGVAEREVQLAVPDIHCAGCIARIERALSQLPGVTAARVNLTTKRVRVRWREAAQPSSGAPHLPPIIETLQALGFASHPHEDAPPAADNARGELIRALAVSGFAAMNIMLLSVSVWAGAGEGARAIFHWLSAAIALPTLFYSGRVFFRSAWRVLRRGRTNMDVPISIGVITAFGLSLHETITHGLHAYFDAAVTLLFFLLIGRTLDHLTRDRARTAVEGLARLAPRSATRITAAGSSDTIAVAEIEPGMCLALAPGERIPVNAELLSGVSTIDMSLVTGESAPVAVAAGAALWAGALNLTGAIVVRATAAAENSFLAEIRRMMEAAENGRSLYRRIADRAARLYAPVVHLTALATLAGWWFAAGDPHRAITIAVAVLIITCPCALGLAVPMVHVAAARRLFAQGIMVKDGAALERLAEVDCVIFDKTGTLTLDAPVATLSGPTDAAALSEAAALASHSLHPYARAIARLAGTAPAPFDAVREEIGGGLEARRDGALYRLGRPVWAQGGGADDEGVVLTRDGEVRAHFSFTHALRPEAHETVTALKHLGLHVEILSGDHDRPVEVLAQALAIPYRARVSPSEKVAHIERLVLAGRRPLMVGDGLNDAPALMAAHASIAPASAADVGRSAADCVFVRESLAAVPEAVCTARRAAALVRQNITLAIVYNVIAVPIAIAGYVTPLIAAIAMSASSVLVVANALRLTPGRRA